MRKLFQEEKWKRRLAASSRRELKKRSKRKAHKNKSLQKVRRDYISVVKKSGRVHIPAPVSFDLQNNTTETIEFFDVMNEYIERNQNLYLDLKKVEHLSTEVVAYMLSRIDYSRQRRNPIGIHGNAPVNKDCNELFVKSGFYDYVYSGQRTAKHDPDVYAIESGDLVYPLTASKIKQFTADKFRNGKQPVLRDLYETLIECMANTRQHAYPDRHLAHIQHKWWLTASFNRRDERIQITFLDNGVGIPRTTRLNYRERIRTLFPPAAVNDHELIESALKGDFRTSTGEKHRGKGLPKIYKFFTVSTIKNLLVVSRQGFVDYGKQEKKELKGVFHGTLLRWDMAAEIPARKEA